jgi:hypothetical protein
VKFLIPEENYSKKINRFVAQKASDILNDNCKVFLCRSDGVLIYQNHFEDDNLDKDSIGVLMGGVWQAAKALVDFIPEEDSSLKQGDFFRLSFDTSSRGVYILPFSIHKSEYYIGVIYFDEVNPAPIKAGMRKMLHQLEDYLEESPPNTRQDDNNSKNLFKDISDKEMDNIFSFVTD